MSIDIKMVLSLHLKWLRGEDGGRRANLIRADLSGANLSGANLRRASLIRADLSGANLSGANLIRADLSGANLSWVDLSGANLSRANLSRANLSEANLSEANLIRADLSGANLSGANLRRASLSGAKDGEVCRMDFGGWSICVRADETSIGCQTRENKKWLGWSPDDVAGMHEDAKEWWAIHGDVIKAAIRCVMSKGKSE